MMIGGGGGGGLGDGGIYAKESGLRNKREREYGISNL